MKPGNQQKMSICLWFDNQAEEAANFYTSIFKNSALGKITRYGKEGYEQHRRPEGTVMTAGFTINGMEFIALNGGPIFQFNESVSIVVECDTQAEIDYYWEKLLEGGNESACGWLKDKFGVSWQITPKIISQILSSGDFERSQRVTKAFMKMKKLEIEVLENA